MGLLSVIEWKDDSRNSIVYRVDLKNDVINKGSALTVRESQVAIFCDKGRMADVFLPGFYKLDTDSLPIITKLMSWKYGFETPFKSDVYFVNTKQFAGQKWGTANPILVRDPEYGAMRVRGYGTYSFRVKDAYVFMQQLSGTNSSFRTQDITEYIRSTVVTGISDAVGESKLGVLDMAANLLELSEAVKNGLNGKMEGMGIEICSFNFENFSLPKELEEALDQSTKLGLMRRNIDVYTQIAGADALRDAAKNPGTGNLMNAGMGMGMGMQMGAGMGQMFGNTMNTVRAGSAQGAPSQGGVAATVAPAAQMQACRHCGAQIPAASKFCPECGKSSAALCVKCGQPIKDGSKFCHECGAEQTAPAQKGVCPKCGAKLSETARFCRECGAKI